MSHALSQAVRVVNLDSEQTPATIAALMGSYLDDFDSDDLTITTSATTVSDVDYIDVSVSFPFDATIPFVTIGEVTLDVATRVPVISSTQ